MTPVMHRPGGWTTPRSLQVGLFAAFGSSLLLMIAAIGDARSHRHAMQAVGRDSAPSIIAAQHIRSALADMDANAANELLDPPNAAAALRTFEDRRREAADAIVAAAQNITYGDAERVPIQKLAFGVGTYSSQVQAARDLKAASDKRFIDVYRDATKTMDAVLLPAASDLDKANRDVLNATYAAQKGESSRALAFLAVTVLMAGGTLIALQIFLSRRMRRTFNPMLMAATFGVLVFGIYAGRSFRAADRELKIAKEDAFESIHALWLTRSLAYWANSDESRYLIDGAQAAIHESDFFSKARRIASLPAGINRADVIRSLSSGIHVEGFTGYLADELNNITFVGEREAAIETLTRYLVYLDLDKRIRGLEESGQHPGAVALCVGNGPGQSDWAFNRFDESLGRTLEVNQKEFNRAVVRGFADVAGFELMAPIGALAIAAFAWLGMRDRIREYL